MVSIIGLEMMSIVELEMVSLGGFQIVNCWLGDGDNF